VDVASVCDAGLRAGRQTDAHVTEALAPNVMLLGVAAGFGAVGKGIPTAAMALATVRDYLRRRHRGGAFGPRAATPSRLRALLLAALDYTNARLFAQSGSNEDFVGSGTSLTAVLVVGYQAFVAHVGDARAYLLRLGAIESLTADDEIFSEAAPSGGRTMVPAKPRMRGLLWRSLGTQRKLEASIADVELLAGDQLALCTDGLHRRLTTEEIEDALEGSSTASEAAARMLAYARLRDDAEERGTAIVARHLLVAAPDREARPPRFDRLRSSVAVVLVAICAISFVVFMYRFVLVPH
jgi:protein phosphatase